MKSGSSLYSFVALGMLLVMAGVRVVQAEAPYPPGEMLLNDPTYGPVHQAVLKALGEEHVSRDRASLLFALQGSAERSGLPVKRILDRLPIELAQAKERGQTPLQAVQSLAAGLERNPPFGDAIAAADSGLAKRSDERWSMSARELIEAAVVEMPKFGDANLVAGYLLLAKAYSGVGDTVKAKAAFESARTLAADHDQPEYQASDYVDIARAQVDGGYSTEALRSLADAKMALSKTDRRSAIAYFTFVKLAVAQAEAKDFGGAMTTARRVASMQDIMGDGGGDGEQIYWTYAGVAAARAKAGDIAGAKATAKLIANKEDAARAMAEVAGALAKSGKYRDAMGIAEQIGDKAAYDWIAKAAADAGDLQEASAAARPLSTEAIVGVEPWASIAAAQVRQKDVPGAKATAAKVQDDRERQFVMARLAAVIAGTGDLAGARDAADSLKEEGAQGEALAAIAEAQAAKGDIAGALATADKITDRFWKSSVPARVAKWQARTGDNRAAMATVRKTTSDNSPFWKSCLQLAIEVAGAK